MNRTLVITSPGARVIHDALVPSPSQVHDIAANLTESQGRALAMLHDTSCTVSNRWGHRTIPSATARTLINLGLVESRASWPLAEKVELTRLGSAVIRHVTGGAA